MDQYSNSPATYRYFLKQQGQKTLDELKAQQESQVPVVDQPLVVPQTPQANLAASSTSQPSAQMSQQPSILGTAGPITEHFGDLNPIEHYSHGFTNGIGIGVPDGTPTALPPGQWKILESFNSAKSGGQGDPEQGINRGYGNSVLAQNAQTGEKLRLSHLTVNQLQAGQTVPGGVVFGATGHTGNTTGPHLNLEYYNPQGQLADPLQSPYAQFLNLAQGKTKGKGGGNPFLQPLQHFYQGYTEGPSAGANAQPGGMESLGNFLANGTPAGEATGMIGQALGHFPQVSSAVSHAGNLASSALPMMGLGTAMSKMSMPVKTGLQDAYANRVPMANALKRYDTTLGDMAPIQPQLDLNLYPDLMQHWQTIYGANNRNPVPQSIGDLANQVRDGLRGALVLAKHGR